jgi:hypothetical protein
MAFLLDVFYVHSGLKTVFKMECCIWMQKHYDKNEFLKAPPEGRIQGIHGRGGFELDFEREQV